MLFVFIQLDLLGQLVETAVYPGTDIAGTAGVLKHLLMFALLAADDRGHDLNAGGLREGHDLIDDLVDGLLFDLLAAFGAVGGAHPGPEQAEIVIDLRHRAHRGAGVFAGGLLVDGDGGGQAVNVVYIGLFHLPQKHPGVGGQALHIAPLTLGIDGVEGEARFAGAGQTGQHHQLVPGDADVHVFQVVGACAFDKNMILHGVGYLGISLESGKDREFDCPIESVCGGTGRVHECGHARDSGASACAASMLRRRERYGCPW